MKMISLGLIGLLSATTFPKLAGQSKAQMPAFRKTTVESILKHGEHMDNKPVELHGRLISGNETSIFMDPSTCNDLKVSGCSLWADFGQCTSISGETTTPVQCIHLLQERSRPQKSAGDGSGLFDLDNVTVRGVVLTVRRDVRYAKSAPKSVRIGFGHLSAYPAQINVFQVEVYPQTSTAGPRTP